MTLEEWNIILSLVETGLNEVPWAWESDWPKEVDRDRAYEIVEKFQQFVKEQITDTMTKWIECDCGTAHQASLAVAALIDKLGRDIRVKVVDIGTWLVPRIYIASHEIKASDIPVLAEQYGWKPITE